MQCINLQVRSSKDFVPIVYKRISALCLLCNGGATMQNERGSYFCTNLIAIHVIWSILYTSWIFKQQLWYRAGFSNSLFLTLVLSLSSHHQKVTKLMTTCFVQDDKVFNKLMSFCYQSLFWMKKVVNGWLIIDE